MVKDVEVCALCETQPASRQGEHVWPQWYLGDEEKHEPGPFAWSHNGQPITNREGVQLPAEAVRVRLMLPVCADCNQALANRFEQPTKEALRALFAANGALRLSAAAAGLVGEWFAKTLLLSIHPRVRWAHPAINEKAIRLELDEVPPAPFCDWLTSSASSPAGLSVWLHRTDPADAGAAVHQVALPRVNADGFTTSFIESSVALHGLCATVVVHPGWAINHPLEAAGLAVRVLLAPVDGVDLTVLPTLGLRTLRWLRCDIDLKPGVLGTQTLPPLRASEDPMAVSTEVWPYVEDWSF